MVLDQHEVSGPVGQDARRRIREALLKQHHHQNHKKLANRIPIVRSFADIGKKQSEPHSMDKNGESNFKCTSSVWWLFILFVVKNSITGCAYPSFSELLSSLCFLWYICDATRNSYCLYNDFYKQTIKLFAYLSEQTFPGYTSNKKIVATPRSNVTGCFRLGYFWIIERDRSNFISLFVKRLYTVLLVEIINSDLCCWQDNFPSV